MPLDVPVLTGQWVQLEPLRPEHRESLRQAANDEQIWAHTLTAANGPYFDVWFDDALAEQVTGRRAPFAVRRVADGRLLGSSSYLDIHLKHNRIEIGSTWYMPAVWGTVVNPECKLLLLQHAFDGLGVNRVALVMGLAMTSNFAMIGFSPAFLIAILWIKKRSFFNIRFLVTMASLGLAGLLLFLVLPAINSSSPLTDQSFWQLLKISLGHQKSQVLGFLFEARLEVGNHASQRVVGFHLALFLFERAGRSLVF